MPRVERDVGALTALRAGSEGHSNAVVPLSDGPIAGAPFPVAVPASRADHAPAFARDLPFEAARSADGAFARSVPSFNASGSFLSNGSSDPLSYAEPFLEAQSAAFNNAEAVPLASNIGAVNHKVAMDVIANIK